ncbi:MAG: hypothetical protein ACRDWN_08705, partial [Acidimicrobiales bacterium]
MSAGPSLAGAAGAAGGPGAGPSIEEAAGGPWQVVAGPAGTLQRYCAPGPSRPERRPVVLLCHELPRGTGGAADTGRAYPALADRLAEESGLMVVAGL